MRDVTLSEEDYEQLLREAGRGQNGERPADLQDRDDLEGWALDRIAFWEQFLISLGTIKAPVILPAIEDIRRVPLEVCG
ncbi:MAG: hypothetical protein JXA67_20420 [Micromonosporaceae bacterium]|nr:hypothetical protein [Micromonosporaceae bacterium]